MPGSGRLVVVVALLVASCTEPPAAPESPPEGRFRIDLTGITVSGISSGGYMANQRHVALSGRVSGAAISAGGPYYCARGSLQTALTECLGPAQTPDVGPLIAQARASAERAEIDPVARLAIDKVWLFHGRNDDVVSFPVMDALRGFYKAFIVSNHIEMVGNVPAAHVMPTESDGGSCETTEPPYLGRCNYDAAGEMLRHFYGVLKARDSTAGELRLFDQTGAATAAGSRALAESGYLFVPHACARGELCRLHVALHGCDMGSDAIGDTFARQAGYNGWAATNRILVLYPQIHRTEDPANPRGCWDWWGYEGPGYATRDGAQIAAIRIMIDELLAH